MTNVTTTFQACGNDEFVVLTDAIGIYWKKADVVKRDELVAKGCDIERMLIRKSIRYCTKFEEGTKSVDLKEIERPSYQHDINSLKEENKLLRDKLARLESDANSRDLTIQQMKTVEPKNYGQMMAMKDSVNEHLRSENQRLVEENESLKKRKARKQAEAVTATEPELIPA